MGKYVFCLTLLFTLTCGLLAGDPNVPMTFQSLNTEILLDQPHGASKLTIICSQAKFDPKSRTFDSLSLETQKEVFEVKKDQLATFLNPYQFDFSYWTNMKTGAIEKLIISFQYRNPDPKGIYELPGKIVFDVKRNSFSINAAQQSGAVDAATNGPRH